MSHSAFMYSMWQSEFCCIRKFVAFGIMSHSGLCRSVSQYVIQHFVAFGVMSFGIMSHLALGCNRHNVIWDCVIWRYVVRRYVLRPTVGVSSELFSEL